MDARRLSEVGDVGFVVVKRPAGLLVPRLWLNGAVERRQRNVLVLVALQVVEDARAFPEDLFERRRPRLHAPAWIGAQDVLDERLVRRRRSSRMEGEAATREIAAVIGPAVVVVLPVSPRTV